MPTSNPASASIRAWHQRQDLRQPRLNPDQVTQLHQVVMAEKDAEA
jgi:hypothetical protein